ncbi:MAG: hypothetical protein U0802_10360 [Candidatus Binatia bacterium]
MLIKNSTDNLKDKLIWKWTKGAATTQPEFGDPTTTANYALCFYAGATPALLQQSTVPPGNNRWFPIGSKGYSTTTPPARRAASPRSSSRAVAPGRARRW